MKSTSKIIIIILIAISTYSCQKDDFEAPEQKRIYGKEIILSENTYVPEELQNFSEVQVDSNKLVLKFINSSYLPTYKTGDIIAGKEGGGYLRKVLSSTVQGNTLTINTSKASLEEAFDKIKIDTSFMLSPSKNNIGAININDNVYLKGQVLNRTITSSSAEVTVNESTGEQTYSFKNMAFKLETPDKTGSFELKIEEIVYTITTEVKRVYIDHDKLFDFDFGLIYKVDCVKEIKGASWVLKGGINDKISEVELFPADIFLGALPVGPVIITFEFNLAAGIQGKFMVGLGTDFISSSRISKTYLVGAEFIDGIWVPIFEKTINEQEKEVNYNPKTNLSAELKGYVKPILRIKLDKTLGPNIFIRLFDYAEVKYPPIKAEVGWGFDGGLGFDIKILSKKIADFKWTITEFKQPAWNYINNIPEFAATLIPADNSFKQPMDINFQWSCSDPDGDGIKYNVYLGLDPEQLSLVSENQDEMSCLVHGLKEGSKYYWRIEAIDNRGAISRSSISSFTTEGIVFNPNLTYGSITDIDGNTYKTIQIGTQTWMAENLKTTRYNDGTNIPLVEQYSSWFNRTTPAYCWYDNDPYNKSTYGALYNWYTVDNGQVCPNGWHVPDIEEWHELINTVEGKYIDLEDLYSAGAKIREDGLNHWVGSTPGLKNQSGFTALPSGLREAFRPDEDDDFGALGERAFFWTTESGLNAYNVRIPIGFDLYYTHDGFYLLGPLCTYGYSIRCVKN